MDISIDNTILTISSGSIFGLNEVILDSVTGFSDAEFSGNLFCFAKVKQQRGKAFFLHPF